MLADASMVGTSQHLALPTADDDTWPASMPGPPKKDKTPRRTLTVRLPVTLIETLKRVAADSAGYPAYSTISKIVEAGITAECDRLEAQLHEAFGSDLATGPEGRSPKHRRISVINCMPKR